MPFPASVCVFCGSSPGADPAYVGSALEVGAELARRGIRLVYGGGRVGMMGAVCEGARRAGGEVVGVIPGSLLEREVGDADRDGLRIVGSMHERKALMSELADAFVALPGGIGTLEELFEVFTWAQLGLHRKPLGLLDVAGYYAPLAEMLDHAVREGFLDEESRALLACSRSLDELLAAFARRRPPALPDWLDREAS